MDPASNLFHRNLFSAEIQIRINFTSEINVTERNRMRVEICRFFITIEKQFCWAAIWFLARLAEMRMGFELHWRIGEFCYYCRVSVCRVAVGEDHYPLLCFPLKLLVRHDAQTKGAACSTCYGRFAGWLAGQH